MAVGTGGTGGRRVLTRAQAAAWLVRASALEERFPAGEVGVLRLLDRLGAIQLDPIDRVGTNAELVAWARVPGLGRGELHRHLRNRCFEHFAKERCLLHPRYFPHYRARVTQTGWWRHDERWSRVQPEDLAVVRGWLAEHGPASPRELPELGKVAALDWSGWKGTSSRTAMALELLWTTCDVVVSARSERGHRVYDLPERALPEVHAAEAPEDSVGWLVEDRVAVAGLLARAGGPTWSMLGKVRTDGTVERLLAEGRLVEVWVEEQSRPYLAPAALLPWLEAGGPPPPPRPELRVLGPLDPLLWDRALVEHCFGFDYVWEVYKPEAERRWGYYVCPLYHRGRLVGRVQARREEGRLVVERLWKEKGGRFVWQPYRRAMADLARRNGCVTWEGEGAEAPALSSP